MTPRVTKTRPSLSPGEVPVKLKIGVPIALFEQPVLSVKLDLPEPQQNLEVSVSEQEKIAEAIQDMLGVSVSIECP